MAYISGNPPNKRTLKEWVADPNHRVRIMPGVSIVDTPEERPDFTGTAFIEGPHYPQPHRWYAKVQVTDGLVTKVLS